MPTNSSRGKYYRLKTRKILEVDGYEVEYMEKYQSIYVGNGKVIHKKNDLFGSDILAMNGKDMRFVQVKLGRSHIAEGIKEFHAHKFPPDARCELWIWAPKEEPDIIEVPVPGYAQPDGGSML